MPQEVSFVLVWCRVWRESEEGARGWRTLLTREEGEVDGIEVFCPDCAEAEFSEAPAKA